MLSYYGGKARLKVVQNDAGEYVVKDDCANVLATFSSNAAAWRFVDRYTPDGQRDEDRRLRIRSYLVER